MNRIFLGYPSFDRRPDAFGLARRMAELCGAEITDPGPSGAPDLAPAGRGGEEVTVLGSSHRARSGRVLPPSIGEALLGAPPAPIAIAPLGFAHRSRRIRSIGVGFDGSPGAQGALRFATGLAGGGECRVELLGVAQPAPLEAVTVSRRAALEEAVAAGLASVPDLAILAEVVYGLPTPTLLRRTADLHLLVIGARKAGAPGDLLGSVAAGLVVGGAECPVIVVPPTASEPALVTAPGSEAGVR